MYLLLFHTSQPYDRTLMQHNATNYTEFDEDLEF